MRPQMNHIEYKGLFSTQYRQQKGWKKVLAAVKLSPVNLTQHLKGLQYFALLGEKNSNNLQKIAFNYKVSQNLRSGTY